MTVTTDSPFIKYCDLQKNGFIILSVFEERTHAGWYYVDDVEDKDGGAVTFGTGFAVKRGASTLEAAPQEVSGLVDVTG